MSDLLPGKSVVTFQSVAEFDEKMLQLTLDRLKRVTAEVLEHLKKRPVPMDVPARKQFPVEEHARSAAEALAWEILLEMQFLGEVAQATKKAPQKRRRAANVVLPLHPVG